MPKIIGKKVDIHFSENVLSEISLPLQTFKVANIILSSQTRTDQGQAQTQQYALFQTLPISNVILSLSKK